MNPTLDSGRIGVRLSRRAAALLSSAAFLLAVLPPLPAYAVTTVTFADHNLETAARTALSKQTGDITDADMATLTSLEATSRGIADLDGLQYATNLESLDLASNLITDVVPVAGLTGLTRLDLSGNKIATITVLGALHPQTVDVSHDWLDVGTGSAALAVIDAWRSGGASVTCDPQGRMTTCTLSTASQTIGYAASVTIAGTLADRGTGETVRDCRVRLQTSRDGAAFADAAGTAMACTTTPGGGFSFKVAPAVTTYYRVAFGGSSYYYLSASRAVRLIPRVCLSTPTAPSFVSRSSAFTSRAILRRRSAASSRRVSLQCYRYEKQRNGTHKWVLRKVVSAAPAARPGYTLATARFALPYTGTWRVRAYHAADTLNAATYSGWRYLTVEDPRIEAAIRWARARLGSHGWDHYCLRFASDAWASGAHTSVLRFDTAKHAADYLHASRHPSANAPRGAYVFYHSYHPEGDLGHVGISLGNGTMISDNGGEGVCIKPIRYGLSYIGWAAPPVSPRISDWD
jgi:hypothetical protein